MSVAKRRRVDAAGCIVAILGCSNEVHMGVEYVQLGCTTQRTSVDVEGM